MDVALHILGSTMHTTLYTVLRLHSLGVKDEENPLEFLSDSEFISFLTVLWLVLHRNTGVCGSSLCSLKAEETSTCSLFILYVTP